MSEVDQSDLSRLNKDLEEVRSRGVSLPNHPKRAAVTANEMMNTARTTYREHEGLRASVGPTLTDNSPQVQSIVDENKALIKAMGNKRASGVKLQRVASGGGTGVGGDVYAAIPRFYDPLECWDLSGLPWNVADEGHRHKLNKWLRLYYATHYLVPILVDIFTRFPLIGMECDVKDPGLKDFYEDLFFNQLDYQEFLVSLGREFWVVGNAYPLGSFDANLGVWENEELLNPEDVIVENFPLLKSKQLKINPPDYLKKLAQQKEPAKEYRQLEIGYPELIPYLLKGERIPISSVMLKQVANTLNDWDDHGTPILLRGLRTLLHEEKLLASQDAIAERLYSPLILAKLGIMDMGDGMPPFIPGPEELEAVRDDFDIALSSDFRLMVHHFGLEVSSVFGREQMPRLGDDFDRIERRLMQSFGISPSLLSAGTNTQPYASSALQAEFMNQMLKTFQIRLQKHFRERALVVAEAQGHLDYITKGKTRVQIYETIVDGYDDDGTPIYKEVPKLLVPELKFKSLDLRDEATQRQFLQTLRSMGVLIPDEKLMVGIDWDVKEMSDTYNSEIKEKTIAQQQAKLDTYLALTAKRLPIPVDLRAEVESVLSGENSPDSGMQGTPFGGAAPGDPGGSGPTAGPGGGVVMPSPPPGIGGPEGLGPGGQGGTPSGGGAPPASPINGPAGTVPEVSNERRPGLTYNTKVRDIPKTGKVAELLEEKPEFGVPFYDFLVDQEDDINDLSDERLEELTELWPDYEEYYQSKVASEIAELASHLQEYSESDTIKDSEIKESRVTNEVDTGLYELKEPNEEQALPERYVKKHNAKTRVKKYSLVDPPELNQESEDK